MFSRKFPRPAGFFLQPTLGFLFQPSFRGFLSFFPLAAALSQRLTRRLTAVREQGILPWARPDGKSQVTVEYDEDGNVSRVHTVIIAIQHDKDLKCEFPLNKLTLYLVFVCLGHLPSLVLSV